MRRKTVLLVIVMLCTLRATSSVRAQTKFKPIDANHWAYTAVTDLGMKGVLEGYPDGTFRGKRPMTRDEFAAAMVRMIGGDPVSPRYIEPKGRYTAQEREARLLKLAPNFYAPVSKDHWAYAAMRELQGAGYWKGYGYSTSFDDRIELKRSAFAMMLHLAQEKRSASSRGGQDELTPEVQGLLDKLRNEFRVEISALDQVETENKQ